MKKVLFIGCFVSLQTLSHAQLPLEKSYKKQQAWQALQQYLPEEYRLQGKNEPQESLWNWKNTQVHIDAYRNPTAKAKVILLHGVGTNGRQMSLILGHPLATAGYETIALDLPGYGLTQYDKKKDLRYDQWVELVNDYVNDEAQKDPRPIFLYGLSAGGMLTLHVAMQNQHVKGIIGMTFLDQRIAQVQKQTMRFGALKPILMPSMKLSAQTPIGNMALPMSWVSKMNTLTNNPQALKIMLNDKSSAGNAMSIKFLNSYMHYQPKMQISEYRAAPILLTQPAEDRWTPLALSEPVLKQLNVPYQVVMLPNGSHYPTEADALAQLKLSSIEFIERNLN